MKLLLAALFPLFLSSCMVRLNNDGSTEVTVDTNAIRESARAYAKIRATK